MQIDGATITRFQLFSRNNDSDCYTLVFIKDLGRNLIVLYVCVAYETDIQNIVYKKQRTKANKTIENICLLATSMSITVCLTLTKHMIYEHILIYLLDMICSISNTENKKIYPHTLI